MRNVQVLASCGTLSLAKDVCISTIAGAPHEVRSQLPQSNDAAIVFRPGSRSTCRTFGVRLRPLVESFRRAISFVKAIDVYCAECHEQPAAVLSAALPLLKDLAQARWLVPSGSPEAQGLQPSLAVGAILDGWTMARAVSCTEDTEIYLVRSASEARGALKIARSPGGPIADPNFERERSTYLRMDGKVNPPLLGAGQLDGRAFFVARWAMGVPLSTTAADLRRERGGRGELLRLCCAVLDAYAHLHELTVVHGDVHPRNVLVDFDGRVQLVDFGHAVALGADAPNDQPPRPGFGVFMDREYARARLAGAVVQAPDFQAEQYSLASLVYHLLTGEYCHDFRVESDEQLRRLAEEPPLPFEYWGSEPWPTVEKVLYRALEKEPGRRYSSVSEFSTALAKVVRLRTRARGAPDCAAIDGSLRTLAEEVIAPLKVVERLPAPSSSVTFGAAGVAYALMRISAAWNEAQLLRTAVEWCRHATSVVDNSAYYDESLGVTAQSVGRGSVYFGASGVSLVSALVGEAAGDTALRADGIATFIESCDASAGTPVDVVSGRSGLLLACAVLQSSLGDTCEVAFRGEQLFSTVVADVESLGPITQSDSLQHLGFAHGWAGILYTLLTWLRVTGRRSPEIVVTRLDELASMAEPYGSGFRWQRVNKHGTRDELGFMPGWCNGSAGYVHLFSTAHSTLGESAYFEVAKRAAWNCFESKESTSNLCCGIAGRAYALVRMFQDTGDELWLDCAVRLAAQLPKQDHGKQFSGHSLYKGKLGVGLLCAELCRPEVARMPFHPFVYSPPGPSQPVSPRPDVNHPVPPAVPGGVIEQSSRGTLRLPYSTMRYGALKKSVLIQMACGPHVELLELTRDHHARCAERHGMDYWQVCGNPTQGKRAGWGKVPLVLAAIWTGYEAVIWLDADAVIVRPEVDLTGACSRGIAMARHPQPNHWNTGVIITRASQETDRFWQIVSATSENDNAWMEQLAVNNLAGRPEFTTLFTALDVRFNSVPGFVESEKPIIIAGHGLPFRMRRDILRSALAVGSSASVDVLERVKTRDAFGEVLNQLGLLGEAVEIGVLRGEFSRQLLDSWRGRILHLVDPWRHLANYEDVANLSDAEHETCLAEAIRRLEPHERRYRIHRMLSEDAVRLFDDAWLDFVYLDANHAFDAVWQDLRAWYPKVRSGGILAGHDFLDGTLPEGRFGVASAVRAFSQQIGVAFHVTEDSSWASWYLRKP